VDQLDLTEEDVRRAVVACRLFRVGTPAPAYLKEFLARRLEEASAETLAARVRHLRDGQFEALCDRIRQEQERSGS
jgi:hypothetical protein